MPTLIAVETVVPVKKTASSSTATVTARVPREIKRQAEKVLKQQGLTPSIAINRLYQAIISEGSFPAQALPDTKVFPDPGERRLDFEAMTDKQKARWQAIKRHMEFEGVDWGDDLGKPYKQIIEEGRRRDYEALSRH